MIYTITLNPSLDYVTEVKDFHMGAVNRTVGEAVLPGGKGINVSLMLKALGCESVATGFLAGFTGAEIRRLLSERGLSEKFFSLKNGFSRINVKLMCEDETEINGTGPLVTSEEKEALLGWLEQTVGNGDTLVLSGSIPRSLPSDIYGEMIRRISSANVRIVADVSGDLLKGILPYRPFLIKPNHHELGELFGCQIKSREDAVFYARQLQKQGAENVMVSLAADGAVLLMGDSVFYAEAPKGTVVNSVGAGDSSVAGFLAGWLSSQDPMQALSLAVAAGSATAFSEGIGEKSAVDSLLGRVIAVRL
jgi:1-phosphofructokinase